jgi:hypothetical protein
MYNFNKQWDMYVRFPPTIKLSEASNDVSGFPVRSSDVSDVSSRKSARDTFVITFHDRLSVTRVDETSPRFGKFAIRLLSRDSDSSAVPVKAYVSIIAILLLSRIKLVKLANELKVKLRQIVMLLYDISTLVEAVSISLGISSKDSFDLNVTTAFDDVTSMIVINEICSINDA